MTSLQQDSYEITNYIVEYHPHLFSIIIDQGKLLKCIESAIVNNQLEVFKQFFHEFCVEEKIDYIEDENIIDDIDEQGENDTFGIEIPFKDDCCEYDWPFGFELESNAESEDDTFGIEIPFKDDCCENVWPLRFKLESNAESMLYLAIHYGNIEMVSYILQKTNIKVTVKLIDNCMEQSREIRGINYEKCIPVFKFLFKQALIEHDAGQVGMELFFIIIKRECVYMLHSLFEIGFTPNNIMNQWDALQQLLLKPSSKIAANILVYLQQRSDLDCFYTFVYAGKSIFGFAIERRCFIVAQALIEAKFGNLSNPEKENAILDLLQQQILKFGGEEISTFIESRLSESSVEGEMANETWHSFYSYLFNKIPIV
ncbi:uncharacterized protein LOC125763815 isoform X5 [Anopheles funestus]|uniref:uncharacterized protein LOC125763815 isoform X5 n=1 Tax=Anopheles funestus TaxID=62324 RepID=UPI0020C72749|nr:uncharacterized protein LOC125763815 isoform X5 [Anopheles funestus]